MFRGMSTSLFLQNFFETVKNFGDVMDVCTRSGEFGAANISFADLHFLKVWPRGEYKVNIVLFDDVDNSIMNGTYISTIAGWTANSPSMTLKVILNPKPNKFQLNKIRQSLDMKLLTLFVSLCMLMISDARITRVYKINCGTSSRSAAKVFCYTKAYDRKNSLLNSGFTLLRKVSNGTVRWKFSSQPF